MVEKYAKEYGVLEYVSTLLAIIEVESGGKLKDVMQSSESLGLPPNTLDTEASIQQGRSEEHTSELQSRGHLVCRLLLEKKNVKSTNLKLVRIQANTDQ